MLLIGQLLFLLVIHGIEILLCKFKVEMMGVEGFMIFCSLNEQRWFIRNVHN